MLLRAIADGLEWSYGWESPAAQRLRSGLDFAYATGLRASELVGARLSNIETDARGDHWVSLIGKGRKAGKVALPPLARTALDRYLVERRLPVTPTRWHPDTPLIGSLEHGSATSISGVRLWEITRRFFRKRPRSSKWTTQYSRKSCVARARTGLDIRMRLTRSHAVPI